MTQPRPSLSFRKIDPSAPDLAYAHHGDSAVDLYSMEDRWVWPLQSVMLRSGIAVYLPEGYEAQVRPRSSTTKAGWVCNLGTVDNRYTGEIKLVLCNASWFPRRVKRGQKIAQLAIVPVAFCRLFEMTGDPVKGELNARAIPDPNPDEVRGDRGFGSTGS